MWAKACRLDSPVTHTKAFLGAFLQRDKLKFTFRFYFLNDDHLLHANVYTSTQNLSSNESHIPVQAFLPTRDRFSDYYNV